MLKGVCFIVYPFVIRKESKMNVFLYCMIFIAGTVFGSFFSLAVYRIPRKENITYVHSHCVNCNHELGVWDLIPVLSYLFLKGKCRYCGERIRARYLLLEVFSGIVFILVAFSQHISMQSTLFDFIVLGITYLFIVGLFLIGGIDKENYLIPDSVLLYMIVICLIHLVILPFQNISVVDYIAGFLIIPLVFQLINMVAKLNREKEFPIGFGDVKYLAVVGLFFGLGAQILVLVLTLWLAAIGYLIHHYKQIPFGYYLSIAAVVIIILMNQISPLLEMLSLS